MTIDPTKIEKVKTAMDNRYEQRGNKKTTISGPYTGDNDSYPTILACLNKFGELVTSWSATVSDSHYPSEKLVKDTLDSKADSSDIPTDVSDLTDISNTQFTPKSHSHGNLNNDGTIGENTTANAFVVTTTGGHLAVKTTLGYINANGQIGTTAGLPIITGTNGVLSAGSFGTGSGEFAEGNHTHSQYLTSHQSLDSKTVTVEKQSTAESGYTATYVIKQGGSALSPKINIPRDYLVKSASVGTCSTADTPVSGYVVGDKYLDFVINTKNNEDNDEHLYVLVSDLIDTYTAGSGLTLSNNEFSISNGDISLSMLASGVQTSLGYADTFHSSPASSITSTQVTNWDTMVSGGMTSAEVDAKINQALDALAEAIYPTSL